MFAGSEYDSDENMDLDEKDDMLEEEAGDADDVGPEEDLRNQVHRVHMWVIDFLRIASYAKRCISYDRFCLTVWPSITVRYHAKATPATIMRSSLEDSPMILVSWLLTSARNSKGNIGSENAEWERGSNKKAQLTQREARDSLGI